jgi:hypothetical protein
MPQNLLEPLGMLKFQPVNDTTYDSIREAVAMGAKITLVHQR